MSEGLFCKSVIVTFWYSDFIHIYEGHLKSTYSSTVQYRSNRLTNPFMFGIILNSYLCSM